MHPPCFTEDAMSYWRLEMHRLQELVRLHRMKTPVREVARLLQMSPNTEREYRKALLDAELLSGTVEELPELSALKAAVLSAKPTPAEVPLQEVSSVARFHKEIGSLLDKGLGPRAIHDRLRLELTGFNASYSSIKRLCRAIRRARGVQAKDVAIPVESAPGEIAQVDFGFVGELLDPETHVLRRAWCFVMVLAYSRHLFARVVFDQKCQTWLRLHQEAFAELGGVVETVVPDNLKSAVVRAAFGFGESPELNRSYRELARHYGFKVDPAPPYQPRKKGKAESSVKYVKRSFFAGREGQDAHEVGRELSIWVREVAGRREHGTTHRRPLEVFEELEREALRPLPAVAYEPVLWRKAKVHPDTHVCFEKRLYSVPWRLIGKKVWVRATPASVFIYADEERVATHSRRGAGPRSTVEEHLPEQRRDLRHRSRTYWEERAALMGPEVLCYIREVFDSDDVLSQLRSVQAMVTHLETFPRKRARAACARASHYGNTTYSGLKAILKKALDLEPIVTTSVAAPSQSAWSTPPRFARKVEELLSRCEEVNHEHN
jgi:transposase